MSKTYAIDLYVKTGQVVDRYPMLRPHLLRHWMESHVVTPAVVGSGSGFPHYWSPGDLRRLGVLDALVRNYPFHFVPLPVVKAVWTALTDESEPELLIVEDGTNIRLIDRWEFTGVNGHVALIIPIK